MTHDTKYDRLSVLAILAKSDSEAYEAILLESLAMLRPSAARYAAKYRGDVDDILQSFAVVFRGYIDRYSSAGGQSWATYIMTRGQFFYADYGRLAHNHPPCNFTTFRTTGRKVSSVSLSLPIRRSDGLEGLDSRDSLECEHVEYANMEADLMEWLKPLYPRLKEVFRLYYGEGLFLWEIGEKMGFSESWASQLLEEGLEILGREHENVFS